eukprot:TRINITY_DN12406_c0_g1_i3.p1 TRINITY_DN12406_c0_g1~~TRINITY_DN12406_c0_g1_i3.p1  ORF type:complete len:497 (+),score=115.53 TRINITY_DN12406_c0_g1_i3:65-1492(+)
MTYQPSNLTAFFVFNPLLGEEETEANKILSFFPKIDLEKQKNYVGLSEGLIAFTRDFSPDQPVEAMHTEKHRQAFYECEKNFWIVLIVENPTYARDNKSPPQYLEDELDDSILQAIIHHAYSMFALFNGKMADLVQEFGEQMLREKLELFLQYYIPTVKFNQLRYFMDITGFQFFPVDKATYLSIQYIVNLLNTTFPSLLNTAIMYDSKLIWTGIEQTDMRVLYNLQQENMRGFFTYFCMNEHPRDRELVAPSGGADESAAAAAEALQESKADGLPSGIFLTGPLRKGIKTVYAPRLYVDQFNQLTRLVVYQVGKLSVFLLVDDSTTCHHDPHFYRRLEAFIAPDLRRLAAALTTHASQDKNQESQYRFLYFNHMNLALKTSLSSKNIPLSLETIKVLRSIHTDFTTNAQSASEVCVRTRNDGWVIGRKSSQTHREFFVLLDEKFGDLTDVSAEVDRLAAEHFNIFIDQRFFIES